MDKDTFNVHFIEIEDDGSYQLPQLEGARAVYIDVTNLDPIVLATMLELASRSKRGVNKYGKTLAENNSDDFLQHAKEEALDLANYLTKLQTLGGRWGKYTRTQIKRRMGPIWAKYDVAEAKEA